MYDKLSRIEQFFFDFLSVGLVLFYSWSAIFEPAATQFHRGIYVIVTYILVFLLYKSKHRIFRILDYLLMAASAVTQSRARSRSAGLALSIAVTTPSITSFDR